MSIITGSRPDPEVGGFSRVRGKPQVRVLFSDEEIKSWRRVVHKLLPACQRTGFNPETRLSLVSV